MNPRTPNERVERAVYGVLGHEIGYSLSPKIFRTVFDALEWPAVYALFDRRPAEVPRFVSAAATLGILGLNVTKPFKVSIVAYMDRLDDSARCTGAVNTIRFEGRRSTGYNTDIAGVIAALKPHAARLRGQTALILGAGGAARAVALTLERTFRMRRLTFAVRSRRAGERMIDSFATAAEPSAILETIPYEADPIRDRLNHCALLVNATPTGTSGPASGSPLPRGVKLTAETLVFDLVYQPRETALLKLAVRSGCRAVGGWPMLVAQAEESFRIWTGRRFPVSSRRKLMMWK
ncbi:MAG: shikimate dehydrogenase [Candidatus Zixiibacteriota bacterium]